MDNFASCDTLVIKCFFDGGDLLNLGANTLILNASVGII